MVPHNCLRIAQAGALFLAPLLLSAQSQPSPELKSILDRLDRLEQENRSLSEQVQELKTQLAASRGEPAATPGVATAAGEAGAVPAAPSTEERLDMQQQRIEEQAQTKVEASQKFPIRITGMALFKSVSSIRGRMGDSTIRRWLRRRGQPRMGRHSGKPWWAWNSTGPRRFWAGRCTARFSWISPAGRARWRRRCGCGRGPSSWIGRAGTSWWAWKSRFSIHGNRVRWRR